MRSVTGNHLVRPSSALDADDGLECRDLAREPGEMRRLDDRGNVLVGTGRLLGDAAHRRALDGDAALTELVDQCPSMPLLQSLMPAQSSAGAVTGGRESVLRTQRWANHDPEEVPMLPPMKTGWPVAAKAGGRSG